MIKISFKNLKEYKNQHITNLQKSIVEILPKFPAPYKLENDHDKNKFISDLLINSFESNNLFLKEYYLTVQFIIESNDYINSKNINLANCLCSQQNNLLQAYINNLSLNSIFSKIVINRSCNQPNSDFKKTIDLLQQFISKRHDAHNHSSKCYKKLEIDLKKQISRHYKIYDDIRNFFLSLKRLYDKKGFNKYRIDLIETLKIKVCPYCNRQYIDVFKRKKYHDKIAIAQLDHFYPRSNFPLYAVSLYNLIPSCAKCNSLKSNKLSSYLYPYSKNADEENKEPYFQLQFDSYDQLRGISSEHNPMIRLASTDPKTLVNANALFHEELYQNHASFVQHLLRVQRLDNSEYRKNINQYFKDYQLTESDLQELLYGFDGSSKELIEKPLAKLAHDIIKFSKSTE